MEITNEIKAKVFAQYLGCKAITAKESYKDPAPGKLSQVDISTSELVTDGESGYYLSDVTNTKLILKPLSSITDEDAIECYKIVDPRGKVEGCEYWTHRHKPKDENKNRTFVSIDVRRIDVPYECLNISSDSFIYYNDRETSKRDFPIIERINNQVFVYQFLQSRGYDLPQYLLGGKTLQEAGLAIYELEAMKEGDSNG